MSVRPTTHPGPKPRPYIPHCPLCGSADSKALLWTRDRWVLADDGRDFEIRLCAHCAVGWTEPPMTPSELARYYPTEYVPFAPTAGFRGRIQKWKYRSNLGRIARLHPVVKGNLLFELGSGNGSFLASARKAGWDVAGIEPSEAGRRVARDTYRVEVDSGSAEKLSLARRYDVVVVRHVIEHVDDSAGVLDRIYRDGLTSGGLLYLKVPTMDGWETRTLGTFWRGWDAPRHRSHFTRDGIRRLLERVGFRDIRIRSEIAPQDWVESTLVAARNGAGFLPRLLAFFLRPLPYAVRLAVGAAVATVLLPAGSGRIIVTARRP